MIRNFRRSGQEPDLSLMSQGENAYLCAHLAVGRAGLLRSILEILAQALHDEGYLDLDEAFIDGSFAPANKVGPAWAKRSAARARRSWPSPIARAFPSPFTLRARRRLL